MIRRTDSRPVNGRLRIERVVKITILRDVVSVYELSRALETFIFGFQQGGAGVRNTLDTTNSAGAAEYRLYVTQPLALVAHRARRLH